MTQPTLDDIKRSIRCDDDCRSHNGPPCNCTRRDKIALLEERDRLATVAEFLTEECVQAYGGWNGPEPSPAEFHISWGMQQNSPEFNPLSNLFTEAERWKTEQLKAAEEAQ